MEPHALRQDAVLAFGRRTTAQPPLAILMQDAATVVAEVLLAPFGGSGELRGDVLVLSIYTMGSQDATSRQHRCAMSDDASMAAFAMSRAPRLSPPISVRKLASATRSFAA